MKEEQREQIAEWVEKYADNALSGDEFEQFQKALAEQPDARKLYLDLMYQDAHLRLRRFPLSPHIPTLDLTSNPDQKPITQTHQKRIWWAVIAAVAASLLVGTWWNLATTNSVNKSELIIATIIDSSDAEWGDCTLPTAIGSELVRGRLTINRGLATIRFSSGAELTLESPAELVIESPLRSELVAGTAVVNAPESAHGFVLSTPTAIAIDHGTQFSITIDQVSRASSIEVIEGEVEVQHIGSDVSRHLKENQRVVVSTAGLSDSGERVGEPELTSQIRATSSVGVHRITTTDGTGRDWTVSPSGAGEDQADNYAESVLVKNPFDGFEQFSRKGYFSFDLSALNGQAISDARFVLTLRPSGLGFASKVPDCEFIVYGLTDQSLDDWSPPHLDWSTAPANLDDAWRVNERQSRELGRFTILRGKQHGQVSIDGSDLVDFLNSDINNQVTLIVVRTTQETTAGGLVHGFASGANSIAAPPALVLKTGF